MLNKIMSKFKDVINNALKKSEELLQEMPQASKAVDFDLKGMFNKIKSKLNKGNKFEVYTIQSATINDIEHEYLIDSKGEPVLYCSYKIHNNFGIVEKSVFQSRSVKGLARRYYIQYLIPKHKLILSDDSLTIKGVDFYVNLFEYLTIKVIDTTTKEVGALEKAEEIYDYFGIGQDKYRFMLTKK